MPKKKSNTNVSALYVWACLRISLGMIFVWAFIDKLFGLGFATCRDAKTDAVTVMCQSAWLEGGSPTMGFLKFGTKGPFADLYQSLAGNGFVDLLFMAGLLLIGTALIAGIGIKIAAATGTLLLLMMWTAVLPPENHPFMDDHIVYILVLSGVYFANPDQKLGLHSWWVKQPIVKRLPILE